MGRGWGTGAKRDQWPPEAKPAGPVVTPTGGEAGRGWNMLRSSSV